MGGLANFDIYSKHGKVADGCKSMKSHKIAIGAPRGLLPSGQNKCCLDPLLKGLL